jgi:hypothetical protein
VDANDEIPIPAAELARANPVRTPNESVACRLSRTALLAEAIELRRRIARAAGRGRCRRRQGAWRQAFTVEAW